MDRRTDRQTESIVENSRLLARRGDQQRHWLRYTIIAARALI